MGNYAACKKYTQKEKKSVHTSDEEQLFINCKKLCRSRNRDSTFFIMSLLVPPNNIMKNIT